MNRYLVMSLVLLFAAGALFAQTAAGTTQAGPNEGGTVMVNTPKGLFVMREGVLAKYDLATLKQEKELELFGAPPAAPAADADRETRTKYFTEIARRAAPALLIPKENSLLLVIGDHFASISQDTLKVEVTGDLTPLVKPTETAGGMGFGMRSESAPGYLLTGNTLYLMRGTEILAVSITTGKVLVRSALPKELQPTQMNFGGMGGMGGGRGNRGNRGGGGGGGAAPAPAPAE